MTVAGSSAIVAGVAAVTTVAPHQGCTAQSPTTGNEYRKPLCGRYFRRENVVVSSQAMMAPTRPVDLSATRSALWLSATTLLALMVVYFVAIDQGAVSV
jgi:hypothetical protein